MHAQEVIGILMSITAISSYINYRFIRLPKSIGITLVTLILSLIMMGIGQFVWDVGYFAEELLEGISFNNTFLHGILSFLLFAGALHVNTFELAKHKAVIATLATVGVMISTFLVGYATYALTLFLGLGIPKMYCFVFGALISPTDPIAVLGILKRVCAPKALEVKIAGEALFNDGIAIVLFTVFLVLATGSNDNVMPLWDVFIEILEMTTGSHDNITPLWIVLLFMQQALGGIVFGVMIGWIAGFILKTVDDYEIAIIITLAVVTGGYTLSHFIAHVSGPISVVVAGLFIGMSLRNGITSKYTIEKLDAFWDLLDEVLNAILFVLIGLEALHLTFSVDLVFASFAAIVITVTARWISVVVPVGSLSLLQKFSPNVVLMMTWGGLRGGISIALALSLPSGGARDFVVVITYAVVIFSMMVQGLTMGPLVRKITNTGSL